MVSILRSRPLMTKTTTVIAIMGMLTTCCAMDQPADLPFHLGQQTNSWTDRPSRITTKMGPEITTIRSITSKIPIESTAEIPENTGQFSEVKQLVFHGAFCCVPLVFCVVAMVFCIGNIRLWASVDNFMSWTVLCVGILIGNIALVLYIFSFYLFHLEKRIIIPILPFTAEVMLALNANDLEVYGHVVLLVAQTVFFVREVIRFIREDTKNLAGLFFLISAVILLLGASATCVASVREIDIVWKELYTRFSYILTANSATVTMAKVIYDELNKSDDDRRSLVVNSKSSTVSAKKSSSADQPCSRSPDVNSDDERDLGFRNDQLEIEFEERLREVKGYHIKRVSGDGACLFRAVADQVYGNEEMHTEVRRLCMDYMEQNREHFVQFITERFEDYVTRKRLLDTHGNHMEIQAISEMYARPVELFEYHEEPRNLFQTSTNEMNAPLRLSYHGNIHYNSVKPIPQRKQEEKDQRLSPHCTCGKKISP